MWVAVLAALVVIPVGLVAVRGGGSSVLGVLSVGLGLLALTLLVVVVVVPSRVRSLTRAFGVEKVLGLHRWLGTLAIVLVGIHMTVAILNHPSLLNPFQGSAAARAGWSSVGGLLLVGFVAVRGRRPGARYEIWARLHVLLAGAALVLAGLHVFWLGNLVADPVMRVVLSALVLVLLGVLAHRWVWRPLFSRQGAYVVYGVRRESETVSTLVLAPVHLRRGGLRFAPGQFVWLRLKRGVVGAEEHPFTIASSARVTGRIELTVRDQGDFSGLLSTLRTGQQGVARRAARLVLDRGRPRLGRARAARRRGRHHPDDEHAAHARRPRRHPHAPPRARRTGHRAAVRRRARRPSPVASTCGSRAPTDAASTPTCSPRSCPPTPAARQVLDYFVCGSPSVLAGSLAALDQIGIPAPRIHTEQFGWSGAIPLQANGEPAGVAGNEAPGGRRHGSKHGRRSVRT